MPKVVFDDNEGLYMLNPNVFKRSARKVAAAIIVNIEAKAIENVLNTASNITNMVSYTVIDMAKNMFQNSFQNSF